MKNKKYSYLGIVALAPIVFLTIFFIWPVLVLLFTGFAGDGKTDGWGVLATLSDQRTWQVTGQTLLQATTATFLATVLGLPAAFLLYRLKFRGRKVLRGILTVPFVLPTVVVAASFLALYGPGGSLFFLGLDRTFIVLIMALVFFNVTVVMRIVGSYWENLDPRQTEAAQMLGASPGKAFLTVTLPNLWRSIASAAALVFLFCATSFGVVFVLGGKAFANIETEIYRVTMQLLDLQTAAILAVIQIVIVVLTLFVSTKIRQNLNTTSTPTDRIVAFKAKEHLSLAIIFILTVLILHVLPLSALLIRSFKDVSGKWSLSNYLLLFQPHASSPLGEGIGAAIFLSIVFAVAATVLALILGLITAITVTRSSRTVLVRKTQKWYETLVMMPLGISAVVLGLGLLLTMNKPFGIGFDLRSSVILLPIAQTLIALPLVIRTLIPAVQRINTRLKESALMLGASPVRIIFTIELPLIKNAIAVAAGFAFATALGEFGAAAFLVRSADKTLPVVIAQLLTNQDPVNHGMGIAAAVILAALTASVMVIAESASLKSRLSWALN